jgi:hypothetical protein
VASTCHFVHDCCTPSERQLFLAAPFPDKGACLEEFEATFGGSLNVAIEAVDKETATFDAEAAEACTNAIRTAVDQCDATALVDATGRLSTTRLLFFVDERDPVCSALAQRGFTRGVVEDGDDCVSNIECADFGICIVDAADGDLTVSGTCRAAAAAGASCEDRSCQPGLICGATRTCEAPPDLAADGDACQANGQCESGFCSGARDRARCSNDATNNCDVDDDCTERGRCDSNAGRCDDPAQTACQEDRDCPDLTGTCLAATPGQCVTVSVTAEICDGP